MDVTIRAFGGSLADAQGLLAVERATFNESPYNAEQLCSILTGGSQRAWLALAGDRVVGFVVAFPTVGLSGVWWEIDLLAVHPEWTGHHLATRLIDMAATYGARVACRARAAVALDNVASLQAFRRAGFRPRPDVCKLLISRTRGLSPSLSIEPSVTIRQATSIREVDGLFAGELPDRSPPDLSLLLAEQKGQVVGYVELVDVETLLYRGTWIESLKAPAQQIRQALVRQAVNQTRAAGLDEIGAMVPERNWPWQQALIASGFRSLGDFRWLVAESRLSGLVEQDRV